MINLQLYDYNRFQQVYEKLLNKWKGKIETLEKCCIDSKPKLNNDTQIKILSDLENLKSYFYTAKYHASSQEESTNKILKELLTEMKKLENEIQNLLKK